MIYGIDISHHQGTVDFEKVSKEKDFVIMKVSQGLSFKDSHFLNYLSEVMKYFPNGYGCYIYNKVKTVEDAKKEATLATSILKHARMPLGVWLDMEDNSMQGLGKELLTQIIETEAEILRKAGYKVGIYCNKYWYTSILDSKHLAKSFPFWIARYSTNSPKDYEGCKMWQYSSKGSVNGIKGNVDLDVCYGSLEGIFEVDTDENNELVDLVAKPTIKKGDRGDNVATLQKNLNNFGYALVKDGIAGKFTIAALIDWQTQNNLVPDGIYGQKSYAKMMTLTIG